MSGFIARSCASTSPSRSKASASNVGLRRQPAAEIRRALLRSSRDHQRQSVFIGEQPRQPPAERAIAAEDENFHPRRRHARNRSASRGSGAVADVTFPEPAQPVARDHFIKSVAPRKRQDAEASRQRPGKAQALGHANAALRLEPRHAILDQNIGLVILRVEAVVPVERAAKRGLRRQQPIDSFVVMTEYELRPSRTERAIAVEDNDRSVVGENRHGRIVPVAVSFLCAGVHCARMLTKSSFGGACGIFCTTLRRN